MRFLLLALLCAACDIHTIPPEGGIPDASGDGPSDGEADAAAWFAVCHTYYFQPGFSSPGCTGCTSSSCSAQQTAELDACSGDSDVICTNMCGQAPPFPANHCQCLEGCLSAACQAAYVPYWQCELSTCGAMCQ